MSNEGLELGPGSSWALSELGFGSSWVPEGQLIAMSMEVGERDGDGVEEVMSSDGFSRIRFRVVGGEAGRAPGFITNSIIVKVTNSLNCLLIHEEIKCLKSLINLELNV